MLLIACCLGDVRSFVFKPLFRVAIAGPQQGGYSNVTSRMITMLIAGVPAKNSFVV